MLGVDFTHARLVDLTKLADQAGPFFAWIEKEFQIHFHSNKNFQDLIFDQLKERNSDACVVSGSFDSFYESKNHLNKKNVLPKLNVQVLNINK